MLFGVHYKLYSITINKVDIVKLGNLLDVLGGLYILLCKFNTCDFGCAVEGSLKGKETLV